MPRSKKAASRRRGKGSGRGKGSYSGNGRHMPGLDSSFVPFTGTRIKQEDDGETSSSLVALEVHYH